jgi:hypothetical protein
LISPLIIQIIGFFGLIFFVISFQQKSRNMILITMLFGQWIFLFHYILLGAWTAAGMNVVGLGRTLVFRYRDERQWASWKYWPAVFIGLFILAGVTAGESWLGILPVAAMCIETTGLWMRNVKVLRIINLFPHPFWFTYNLIKGSVPGVVCEIFVVTSILTAIYRYDIIPARKKSKAEEQGAINN